MLVRVVVADVVPAVAVLEVLVVPPAVVLDPVVVVGPVVVPDPVVAVEPDEVLEPVDPPADVVPVVALEVCPDAGVDVDVLDEPFEGVRPDPEPEPACPPASWTGRQAAVAATAAVSSPTANNRRRFRRSITREKIVPPGSFSGCPAGVVGSDSPCLRVP